MGLERPVVEEWAPQEPFVSRPTFPMMNMPVFEGPVFEDWIVPEPMVPFYEVPFADEGELALPLGSNRYEVPAGETVTMEVESIMDLPEAVTIDTEDGPVELKMYSIPPRTSPIPTFEGFDDFNPFFEGMFEPDFSDLPLWVNGLGNKVVDFPVATITSALRELDQSQTDLTSDFDDSPNEISDLNRKPKQKNFKAKIVKKIEPVPFMDNDLQSERIKKAISEKFLLVQKKAEPKPKVEELVKAPETAMESKIAPEQLGSIADAAHKAASSIKDAANKAVINVKNLFAAPIEPEADKAAMEKLKFEIAQIAVKA